LVENVRFDAPVTVDSDKAHQRFTIAATLVSKE
jgi:hypothetical protein